MLPFLFDLLFPRLSLDGAEGRWITDTERRNMRLASLVLREELLRKKGLRFIDAIVAAGRYDDCELLRKAILTFKYRRVRGLAEDLSLRMAVATHGLLITPFAFRDTSPVLCPVPLHWSRLYHRGFNQALLLAEGVARAKRWPIRELLRRTRPTGHQAHRGRSERLTALADAFAAIASVPPYVVLVDDLATTGTTLDECAGALKKAGAKRVVGLVMAYG